MIIFSNILYKVRGQGLEVRRLGLGGQGLGRLGGQGVRGQGLGTEDRTGTEQNIMLLEQLYNLQYISKQVFDQFRYDTHLHFYVDKLQLMPLLSENCPNFIIIISAYCFCEGGEGRHNHQALVEFLHDQNSVLPFLLLFSVQTCCYKSN